MPTPRQHGGAALALVPLTIPGFKGLNTQQASGILAPEWATELMNAVIDDNSRVAARKGWNSVTTSAFAGDIEQLTEFLEHDGTSELVAATSAAFIRSQDGGASWDDVTNSIAFTGGNWQFQNFNDLLYGAKQGEDLVVYNATNFSQIAATNVPSGNCLLAAFGRLWASDSDGVSLQYSGLLNGSDWDSSDAGVFDLTNIWPETDTIQALAAFNGALVVFGKNNIVVFTDGKGSALGIDPLQMYVVDTLRGVGCIARDSVQQVDGDLWFLSNNGLQSFGRLLNQKSNPIDNLSKNIQDFLRDEVRNSSFSLADLRSAYSARDRFYLLSLPRGATGSQAGTVFIFDTRGRLDDGSARCMGLWDQLVPTALVTTLEGVLYMALFSAQGEVGTYAGALDDGESYHFTYESGWLDLTQQGYLIFPKRYEGLFFSDATITVNFKWAFDFQVDFHSQSKTFVIAAGGMEWGVGEWGIGEWGGGVNLRRGKIAASRSGEYIKLGIDCEINNTTLAIQQLDLFAKVGRYA